MRDQIEFLLAEVKGWWRFRWLALGVAWLVCVVGWVGVLLIPDAYKSEARVYVDSSSVLRPLLEQLTVNTDVRNRVEMVTTVMLGRPQLEKVARDTDLHLRAETQGQFADVISGLRSRIEILNNSRSDPNLYTIVYTDLEPEVAQDVVSTLLNNFVEDSLGENRVDAQNAQQFLRDQLELLDQELSESEQRLAEFKRKNVGRMPDASGDYFDRLQAKLEVLEDTEEEIRLAERRKQALQQQLTGESPTIGPANSVQSDVDRRIEQNETRLADLRLRYTELHPDVIAIRETLEELKAQREAELEALRNSDVANVASDNPVFQNIQIELTGVNVELAALREQAQEERREIEELRSLIDVLPQVEAELTRLTRDYDVKQAQYQALLNRLEVAELSESAEQSEDVKFRIIEPPVFPERPAAPNRPVLVGMVLLVGLGAGVGLSFLLNQLNPVFTSAQLLRQATGLPVLGGVQIMRTAERKRWRIAQLLSFGGGLMILFVAFVVVLIEHDEGSRLLQSII